ncbi:hypothetical protein AAII07_55330 [Microvirga sp. 0TCS3.31]
MTSSRNRRKSDRERKATERAERKRAGIPEQATLDRALVDALRDALGRRRWRVVRRNAHGGILEIVPSLHGVVYLTRKALLARGLNREAIDDAIRERLRTVNGREQCAPPAAQPSQISEFKTDDAAETAPSGLDAHIQAALDAMLWGRDQAEA